jgi:hypothetical protein
MAITLWFAIRRLTQPGASVILTPAMGQQLRKRVKQARRARHGKQVKARRQEAMKTAAKAKAK